MSRAWKRLLGPLRHNVWWKLFSLVIAVVIWALVASEPELSTFTSVPVEYKNLPENLEISSQPVYSVMLELRGPSGELRGIGDSLRPSVVLDMSKAAPGERTYSIGSAEVKLARGVRLVRSIPSEFHFHFEPVLERLVPVEVRLTGQDPSARAEVTPRQVRIAGPANRVARIRSVLTDEVDLARRPGNGEYRVNLFVEDPYVRLEGPSEATVRVTTNGRMH